MTKKEKKKKIGRPPKGQKMIKKTYYLTKKHINLIDVYWARTGKRPSDVIRLALDRFFKAKGVTLKGRVGWAKRRKEGVKSE